MPQFQLNLDALKTMHRVNTTMVKTNDSSSIENLLKMPFLKGQFNRRLYIQCLHGRENVTVHLKNNMRYTTRSIPRKSMRGPLLNPPFCN